MPEKDTRVLDNNDSTIRKFVEANRRTRYGTSTLGTDREVVLHINGYKEYIRMAEGTHFELGRFEFPESNQLNLTHYGALEHGISRLHAKFYLLDGNLYIADLGSTNGTYVRGEMIQPAEPTILYNGDEILLGRLRFTIQF